MYRQTALLPPRFPHAHFREIKPIFPPLSSVDCRQDPGWGIISSRMLLRYSAKCHHAELSLYQLPPTYRVQSTIIRRQHFSEGESSPIYSLEYIYSLCTPVPPRSPTLSILYKAKRIRHTVIPLPSLSPHAQRVLVMQKCG